MTKLQLLFFSLISLSLITISSPLFAASTTYSPTDDLNTGQDLGSQLAASKWKHSFFRFDISDLDGDILDASFKVYYEEENTRTFFVGGVEDDNWSEPGPTPARTFIHNDPSLQLDSVTTEGSGYIVFNVADFVVAQAFGDSIVTLELSANVGSWNLFSSKEGANPPELIIETSASDSPPVITLIGSAEITLIVGANYTELGATAFDQTDGDITTDISIDSSAVDTSQPGTYQVIYTVIDSSGNTVEEIRTVIVEVLPAIDLTLNPTDDLNTGYALPDQLVASKWKHSFFRFDVSGVQLPITNATFRVYYEEENTRTFFVGGVEDDNWSEPGPTPARTFIHNDPALQLDSVSATGSGYVEFNVTDFVVAQAAADGFVTLELSANTGSWNLFSSRESDTPPELVIVFENQPPVWGVESPVDFPAQAESTVVAVLAANAGTLEDTFDGLWQTIVTDPDSADLHISQVNGNPVDPVTGATDTVTFVYDSGTLTAEYTVYDNGDFVATNFLGLAEIPEGEIATATVTMHVADNEGAETATGLEIILTIEGTNTAPVVIAPSPQLYTATKAQVQDGILWQGISGTFAGYSLLVNDPDDDASNLHISKINTETVGTSGLYTTITFNYTDGSGSFTAGFTISQTGTYIVGAVIGLDAMPVGVDAEATVLLYISDDGGAETNPPFEVNLLVTNGGGS